MRTAVQYYIEEYGLDKAIEVLKEEVSFRRNREMKNFFSNVVVLLESRRDYLKRKNIYYVPEM